MGNNKVSGMLVLQTDFGLQDGAVAAMYGVSLGVNPDLKIYNLTHEIETYNIWDASYRLVQTLQYWPEGTVFVSVVDPGVGSDRKSIVAKTKDGKYVVTPDNGTLTHIHSNIGIEEIREIDETRNRLPYSGESYTFHGRDIYAFTGARLASGVISYEEVGEKIEVEKMELLQTTEVKISDDEVISGTIDILDIRFGNLWTNIDRSYFEKVGITYGDTLELVIKHNMRNVYNSTVKFVKSFAEVHIGRTLLYVNSLDKIGVAINQGSFSRAHQVESGYQWTVELKKIEK